MDPRGNASGNHPRSIRKQGLRSSFVDAFEAKGITKLYEWQELALQAAGASKAIDRNGQWPSRTVFNLGSLGPRKTCMDQAQSYFVPSGTLHCDSCVSANICSKIFIASQDAMGEALCTLLQLVEAKAWWLISSC